MFPSFVAELWLQNQITCGNQQTTIDSHHNFWFSLSLIRIVQLCDNLSRLVFIKTPRSIAAKLRAILTCFRSVPTADKPGKNVFATLTVLGEHGSLRTAKRAMIAKLCGSYREHVQKTMKPPATSKSNEKVQKVGEYLQSTLQELHAIEF